MKKISNAKDYQLKWMISLLVTVAIIVAYGQVRNFAFVGYDDQLYVTDNINVQAGITVKGIVWAFTTHHDANWFPITWLSHMLDVEFYGLNPMGHHWTNVQLHIANTLLLFFVLQLMTGAIWKSAFVSALFALHPLHVESVAWVAERKDVLSTFFGILMIAAYYLYVKKSDLKNYLLVIMLFGLGLMAKPMLVTFPFLLLLLDVWPYKRFQFMKPYALQPKDPTADAFQGDFWIILEKIPLVVMAAVSSVLTFIVQHSEGAVKTIEALSLKTRVANALVSYASYVIKAVWPHKLAVFYPHPGTTLPVWQILGAALLLGSAIIFALYALRRYPYLAVGLFWFLGTLVPVIGLVQVGEQAMADRYTYVPLIGLFIIVAWGIPDLLEQWRYRKIILGIFFVITISAMTVCTFFQVSHWRNGITLFENAVGVTKNNYQAQNNLGTAVGRADLDRAIFHYKEALKIKPDYATALYNLGTALFYKGNYDQAAFHYKQALSINPEYVDAHYNLGDVLIAQGKTNSAIAHYFETIRINPDYAKGYNRIGLILALQGKNKKAEVFFLKAIQVNPDYMEARKNIEYLKRISQRSEQGRNAESGLKP